MFLSFSDWTVFTSVLDRGKIPHGGRIIKVYTSYADPREIFGRKGIFVVDSCGKPFEEKEKFCYGEREYAGNTLENSLSESLPDSVKERIRALFRFSNWNETQICQYAMSIRKRDGNWLFQKPLDIIHGLDSAVKSPIKRGSYVHLDVFSEASLLRLQKILDIDRPELLVANVAEGIGQRNILRLLESERVECAPRTKEIF